MGFRYPACMWPEATAGGHLRSLLMQRAATGRGKDRTDQKFFKIFFVLLLVNLLIRSIYSSSSSRGRKNDFVSKVGIFPTFNHAKIGFFPIFLQVDIGIFPILIIFIGFVGIGIFPTFSSDFRLKIGFFPIIRKPFAEFIFIRNPCPSRPKDLWPE